MKNNVPEEVLVAITRNLISTRIIHQKREDGTNCSVGKSPSMVIVKRHTHWFYYCFRCKMCGEIPFETNTPKQTLKLIRANKTEQYKQHCRGMHLPDDFVHLSHKDGPAVARTWLWKYGIGTELWKKHNIGWSDSYQRLIFPIRERKELKNGVSILNILVGWLARDVSFVQQNNKLLFNAPKYLLKTEDEDDRKYFALSPKDKSGRLVIVEDILSAIKIFAATEGKFHVLALLNSSIDPIYLFRQRKYKNCVVKVWLDHDKRTESVMQTARLAQMGFTVNHVYSLKDPKEHLQEEIVTKLSTLKVA